MFCIHRVKTHVVHVGQDGPQCVKTHVVHVGQDDPHRVKTYVVHVGQVPMRMEQEGSCGRRRMGQDGSSTRTWS